MTKEQLILLLKNYKENKAKLKLKLKDKEKLLRKIEQLEEIDLSAIKTEVNCDIHSKNSISDKTGNTAAGNIDKEKEYREKISYIEAEIKELNEKIEEVDIRLEALKFEEKQILIAYYIDGCTYEDIGNRVYWELFHQTRSTRNIQTKVKEATEKMMKV